MELVPSEYRNNLKVINELLQSNTIDKILITNINELILCIKAISQYHTFLVYLYYLKARITKENIYFIAARDIYIENYYYLDNVLAQELDWNTFNFTIYEFADILYYNDIYFIPESLKNTYTIKSDSRYIALPKDHIKYRYKIIDNLGKGSFSNVYKCMDHKFLENVAVKIIRNEARFNRQVKIEIKILKQLALDNNKYMYTLLDHFDFRNHTCLVFHLFKHNLYHHLKKKEFRPMCLLHVKQISYQMLTVLETMNKYNIIHTDLKPENVVIDYIDIDNIKIKVIDFGSATYKHNRIHTYIQSRYYRAPEILLGIPYDIGIDLWSIGCIIYELMTGNPLFNSKNETDLILAHYKFIGKFDDRYISKITKRFSILDRYNISPCLDRPYEKLEKLHKHEFLCDFLKNIFKWSSEERLSISQALEHPFIN